MKSLLIEKIDQAVDILREKNIDLWLTFVRETSAGGDPILPLIYGHDLTWQSALIITKTGERIAIVGHYEAEAARKSMAYLEVIPYHESIKPHLISVFERLHPEQIALNFSKNDVQSDGLTLGLYQVLLDYLNGSSWPERIISSEEIITALRGRKVDQEVNRIRTAIKTTEDIFFKTFEFSKPGMSEIEIAAFMQSQITEKGLAPAWDWNHCPTVNAGPESPVGHVAAGGNILRNGHVLHIDFGVKENQYCSDIQRVAYVMHQNENNIPEPVQRGFDTIVEAIQESVKAMRPGKLGKEIDAIARNVVTLGGYPEYKYATGHHLGRLAHDGAGVIGPEWERYGNTPNFRLEEGHVYTIEPGLAVPDYGYIGIEENVLVTNNGGEFLSLPQTEMIIIK